MTIWVDADSCPRQVRDVIARASLRVRVPAVFVANREIPVLQGDTISMTVVEAVEGRADSHIKERVVHGDIVITRDIPLAADLVALGILVLNDRGVLYTQENVRERLSVRNFMKDLRDGGLAFPEVSQYNQKNLRDFAAVFDRELRRLMNQQF